MDKNQKIEYLEKFETLTSEWFELRQKGGQYDRMHQITIKLAKFWGVISEILKGLDYKLEIEIVDPNRSKSIKPRIGDVFHDGVFSVNHTGEQYTNLSKIYSYVLSAKEKINQGLIVRESILPSVNVLLSVLNSFPDVVSRLKHRRSGKSTLDINDEYDIQDILYVMLKGMFPTLQYEDPTSKVGPNSSRADFTILDLCVFIEVKHVSQKGKEKTVHDECLTDIQKYGKQEGCQKIIFFIYDPNKCIDNQYAYKTGLGTTQNIDGKDVEIISLIFN